MLSNSYCHYCTVFCILLPHLSMYLLCMLPIIFKSGEYLRCSWLFCPNSSFNPSYSTQHHAALHTVFVRIICMKGFFFQPRRVMSTLQLSGGPATEADVGHRGKISGLLHAGHLCLQLRNDQQIVRARTHIW